jgi:effector-binding domain-containing protein
MSNSRYCAVNQGTKNAIRYSVMKNLTRTLSIITTIIISFSSCGGDKNEEVKPDPASIVYKTDTSKATASGERPKPPIINIVDTIATRNIVIVVKDSAGNSQHIGLKLSRIYDSILPAYLEKNKLKRTGPRMAWYKSSKAPFFFEAGFPVDKKPVKPNKKFIVREIGGDSALVAHFYGPYEATFQAYQAVNEYMKDYKKKSSAPPYEVYISEPFDEKGRKKDPYKILTDIVFPRN